MTSINLLDTILAVDRQYRETVLYPAAARQAAHQRELRLLRRTPGATPRRTWLPFVGRWSRTTPAPRLL